MKRFFVALLFFLSPFTYAAVGDLVQKKEALGASGDLTAVLDSTATSGNLLVAIYMNGQHQSQVQTSTSGWTNLYLNTGYTAGPTGGYSASAWYKVSVGTETQFAVTDDNGGPNANSGLLVFEYEWGGEAPTVQTDYDTSLTITTGTSVSMGPLTPTETTNNITLAWTSVDRSDNLFTGRAWTPSGGTLDNDLPNTADATTTVNRWVDRSTSISPQFSSTDTGDQILGALVIFSGSVEDAAPVYTVTPATTSIASTQIDTTATATDDVSTTVEHCGVVVADGATVPSAAQIMLGQDSTGSPATAADCNTVTSGSAAPLSFTGLTSATAYDLHFTVEDGSANRATIQSLNVTTASGNTVNYDQSAYDVGDTVSATAEGIGTAITTITEQAGGDSISANGGATSINATFTLPGGSAFLSGGSLENTQLGASLVWRITDGTDTADGSFAINQFGDYFFPLDCNAANCGGMSLVRETAAETGDEVLIRILDGTGVVCSDSAVCTSNDTLMQIAVRWFDVSATQWSTEVTHYIELPSINQLTPEQIEVLGLENCGGGNYRLTCP